jgi:hypothetical protein
MTHPDEMTAPPAPQAARTDRRPAEDRRPGLAATLLQASLEQERGGPLPAGRRRALAALLAGRLGAGGPPASGKPLPLPPPAKGPGQSGELFQDILTRLDPRAARRGLVYTPWSLARHLATLLEPDAAQRWLDPAAGAGIFLQAAVALGATPARCHALEWDPVAAELGRNLLPAVRWRVQDTLAPLDELPRRWRGSFDRVILNPPFRNGVEGREAAWVARRDELRTRFATAHGPFDLYVPFVERALDFLAPGGKLGLLLPTAWLASAFGGPLRRMLAARTILLRLQHAPGCRFFPRADFEILLLVVQAKPRQAAPGSPPPDLLVEQLDRQVLPRAAHIVPQAQVEALARPGWGPLLCPPSRRRGSLTGALGQDHAVLASLSAAEFYTLEVRESPRPATSELMLLSSGAIEPFHHTWGRLSVRFRGSRRRHPVVPAASLSSARREQSAAPRVLIANLSRRLEAVAVEADTALGVVNVIQVLCPDMEAAHGLAAWLNSAPLQEWVRTWHDPLRLNGQLSLNRSLVRGLPAPPARGRPGQEEDARRLATLGRGLAALAERGDLDSPGAEAARQEVDGLAARWLPLESSSAEAGKLSV